MANKNSNVPYDQIPHIVKNHPNTMPEHWAIMICLYKVLKDKKQCIYTNESLSKFCRIPERSLSRRLDELESWGFINRIGKSYARRFSLGLLFYTTAIMAGSDLHTTAKSAVTPAKNDINPGHCGRDTKNPVNHSFKGNLSLKNLNHFETKEIELCIKQGFSLSYDFKYLQPLLDEVLKKKQ